MEEEIGDEDEQEEEEEGVVERRESADSPCEVKD
jgi:hypothetical protein